ncbi:MAG: EFR1 family ferrodoxin [Bacteroidales bacterium]
MQITKINALYFSATNTTKKIVKEIIKPFECPKVEYDLIKEPVRKEIEMSSDELLVIGMPVYSGRIPYPAIESIKNFKGNQTPVVISCIYGNRHYDDALVEIQDLVEESGFKIVSAAAFIAQHSIMPDVASNRPDQSDLYKIQNFSVQSARILSQLETVTDIQKIKIKGNRPYKVAGKIPVQPQLISSLCNQCNTCISQCPVDAISATHNTDKTKCISCGRCIYICPKKARKYKGVLYKIAKWKFTKDNKKRKEPEIFYASY